MISLTKPNRYPGTPPLSAGPNGLNGARKKRGRVSKYTKEEKATQAVKCFELRLTGASYRQIALELDLSAATVYKRIRDHIASIVSPKVEEIRKQHDAEFDRLKLILERELHYEDIENPTKAAAVRMRAVELKDKIMASQRKMHGVDTVQKIEVSGTITTPFDKGVADLLDRMEANDPAV